MFEEMPARHLFGFLALAIGISVIIMFELSASDRMIEVVFQLVLYVFVPVLYFSYYFHKQGISVSDVLFLRGLFRWLPLISGLVCLSFLFSAGMLWFQMYILLPVAPWLVDFFTEPIPLPGGTLYAVFTLAIITVIGPIAEEFIFRGVLMKRILVKTTMWSGVIISSLIFGMLHADIVGAFLFGVLASLLYLRTGNLLVPILFHAVNNSVASYLMFVPGARPDWLYILDSTEVYAKATAYAAMLICSAFFILLAIWGLSRGLEKKLSDEQFTKLLESYHETEKNELRGDL
ncbi:CPBP family intramembrane glutamic endopeptidase [Planomicrobium sp. CPCC 101079]|uniref:CPBP family intramembrane glutamic endopeptidase n=1 Tax=Planomicrobium sp. CPCC 101079 TaxID=2599618 RepID=UPI0011B73EC8|nr:type II CAAX endopeptidase family protein [Planomicrobium sp. CPCC 101079]TWT01607.1 CPBP family intramembrane metalloprotease [Planomicrobium sp. CPCC 101079]